MTEFDMAINTLNQISIKGEEDASRLLGVCNFLRETASNCKRDQETISSLRAELEARAEEAKEE